MKPSSQFQEILEVLPPQIRSESDLFLDILGDSRPGLTMYVKTIYVGVELDGAMIAAVYPTRESLNVVLALDSNHPNSRLEDATHLTWRTMPVMFKATKKTDFKVLNKLFDEALERVSTGTHDVDRPAEYFRGRVSRLSHDPKSGKKR